MSKSQTSFRIDDGILARLDQLEGSRSKNAEILLSAALAQIDNKAKAKNRKSVTVRLGGEKHKAIVTLAAANGRTTQEQINHLIDKGLEYEVEETQQRLIQRMMNQLEAQHKHHALQNKINEELLLILLMLNNISPEEVNMQRELAERAARKATNQERDKK